jgi:hypothetical protein
MSLMVAALASCGGSGGSTGTSPAAATKSVNEETVAQVGNHAITRGLLNQWMTAEIGSSYYEVTKRQAPAQLVSDPPNYPACAAALKSIEPILHKGRPQPTATELESRCEQLYRATKAQTLAFLVASYWNINFDAARGLNVTDAQVQQDLEQTKATQYPAPGQFQKSLVARRRTLSQERFLAKVGLLVEKLKLRLRSKDKRYANLTREVSRSEADATCRTGYVVLHCKQFRGRIYGGRSPAALLRE